MLEMLTPMPGGSQTDQQSSSSHAPHAAGFVPTAEGVVITLAVFMAILWLISWADHHVRGRR